MERFILGRKLSVTAFILVLTCASPAWSASIWHLSIPLSGGGTIPSGDVFSRSPNIKGAITEVAVFNEPSATINYMEITFTDTAVNPDDRNYDAIALVHSTATFDWNTTVTGRVGAGQIGRYTAGFPSVMTFYARKDFDTGAFSCSTVGNGTGENSFRSPFSFGPSGIMYARYFYFRGDGGTGPTVSNIRLLMNVTCTNMPGAYMTSSVGNKVQWRPSPAQEAVAQKVYRATSAAGPFTLVQSFADNATSSYTDATVVQGNTYYYKVVAESAGGVAGADSNVLALTIPTTLVVNAMSPSPGSTNLTSLSNITFGFNVPVLAGSVSTNSVLLVRAGTDGLFDTADDVSITIPGANITQPTTSQLTISLAGLNLPQDKYRVSLIGGIKGTTGSSDKMITVPGFGMSIPTGDFTVEFWQRFDGASTNTPTTFELNPIVNGNNFRFRSPWNSGPDYLFWHLGADSHQKTNVNDRVGWHHFALVKNGATSQVYWNGALIISEAQTSSFTPYQADLELPHATPSQVFIGRIDEFRIWSVARTQAQIQTYMKRTVSGKETGLLAYWDFNEGTGTGANDKTGHGYNGTMASPPVWNISDVPLLPAITDLAGSTLDGEFSGTLPSGNALPGGDFSAQFTLTNTPPPPFNITTMTPLPGSVQTSTVTSILLNSSTNFDPLTINTNTVKVRSAGPDGNLDTADDVLITPNAVSIVNGNQIKVDLAAQANQHEKYRITLNGTTLPVIKDLNGSTLDGEYPGQTGDFPSGNGTSGGDFTATFQVDLFSTTTVASAPQPIAYGTSSIALNASVNGGPVQNINTGSVTFQLKNGAGNVGSPVSGNVTLSTANVNYSIPSGTPIGPYTIVATYSGGGLYTTSSDSSRTFDINKGLISVTAGNFNRAYAAPNPTLTGTVTGIQYGENITAAYSTIAALTSSVGNYPIVPTLVDAGGKLSNYTTALNNGILTVTAVPLTVNGANATRAYGAANPAFSGTISGIKNGDDITAIYASAANVFSNTGPHPIVPTLVDPGNKLGNYTVTLNNGTLTVTKVPLSAAALNGTRAYGASNPLFSGIVSGVLNGDNLLAQYSSPATPSSPIGLYPIIPQFADPDGKLDNYTVNLSNGTLEVTKSSLSVTPADATRPIGAPNPALIGAILGVQNEDNISATYTSSAAPDSALGAYPIVASLNDPDNRLGNYVVALTTGTLTVIPATPPSITSALSATVAKDAGFAYTITADGSAPMTFDATGLPPGLLINGSDIIGAPSASGVFSVTLTANNFGGSDSKNLKLTVIGTGTNHAPVLLSAPTVSNNPATTGVPVTFSAQAEDSDGDALDFTWNFGDGATGSGTTVFKTYAAAGVYIVTLTVTDGQSTAFQSLNLLVQDQPAAGTFVVEKAKLTFNFTKTGKDNLSLSGKLPLIGGADPTGKNARVLIGLLDVAVGVNAKGHLGSSAFKLRVNKGAGSGAFTFALKNQDLFAKLQGLGFSKTQSSPRVIMPVIVALDGQSYLDQPAISYTVKSSKAGPSSGKGKK